MKEVKIIFTGLFLISFSISSWSQNILKGTVKDSDNIPIIGASVVLRTIMIH